MVRIDGPGNRSVSVKPQNLVVVVAGGGDWAKQAEDPEVLFLALGADVVQQMAADGDRDAQFSMGAWFLSTTAAVLGKRNEGMALLEKAAGQGHAYAMINMAEKYAERKEHEQALVRRCRLTL